MFIIVFLNKGKYFTFSDILRATINNKLKFNPNLKYHHWLINKEVLRVLKDIVKNIISC